MSAIQPLYLVLNAPEGADVNFANRTLTLGQGANSAPAITMLKVDSVNLQAPEAEVQQVDRVTLATFAANTNYAFQISQTINGVVKTVTAQYYSSSSDSLATVRAGLISVVNALQAVGQINVTATPNGTATIIDLTGNTGNPVFITQTINACTVATATAGQAAVGTGAQLLAQNFSAIDEVPVVGNEYFHVTFNYGTSVQDGNTIVRDQVAQLNVYANVDGADFADFVAALNTAIGNAASTDPLDTSATLAVGDGI